MKIKASEKVYFISRSTPAIVNNVLIKIRIVSTWTTLLVNTRQRFKTSTPYFLEVYSNRTLILVIIATMRKQHEKIPVKRLRLRSETTDRKTEEKNSSKVGKELIKNEQKKASRL